MTQRFLNDGKAVAVSVISAGPCHVTFIRNVERDGYEAVQVGFDPKKKLGKAEKGHLKNLPAYRILQEFPQRGEKPYSQGDQITVSEFVPGDEVKVTGVVKGKGYQGVVRRHGFGGSPATHGHKDQLRMPGSIGATAPQRVPKGRRMAGQMGNTTATIRNLEVIEVLPEEGMLIVKGAIPGANGSLVSIFSDSIAEPVKPEAETPKQEEKK